MAVARVKQRVIEGGHHIPTDVVHRRYHGGLKNFFQLYLPEVDQWWLSENLELGSRLIAHRTVPYELVYDLGVWEHLLYSYGKK